MPLPVPQSVMKPVTRSSRPTPYLAVDLDLLEANVARMAAWADERGLALRPHAKTHKSPDLARLQLASGAVGLSVATVAEAEVMVEVCDDLVVTFPLWVDQPLAGRLRALATRVRVAIGVDSVTGARQAAGQLAGSGVEVLVEVDSGQHRTGCDPHEAGRVGLAAAPLVVRGAFTFPGHAYAPGVREEVARAESVALADAAGALRSVGLEPRVLSGGSTPSVTSADAGVLTEVRPGVYPFGDAQQVALGTCTAEDVALVAVGTVVHRREGVVVLDAGSKVCAADRPAYAAGHGFVAGLGEAVVVAQSEHHATVAWPTDAGDPPALGTRLGLVPNHVCNAVNLVDVLVLTRAGVEVGTWPVAARGALG